MHVFASTFVEIPSECIEKRMLRDKKNSYNNRSPTEQASNLIFCLLCASNKHAACNHMKIKLSTLIPDTSCREGISDIHANAAAGPRCICFQRRKEGKMALLQVHLVRVGVSWKMAKSIGESDFMLACCEIRPQSWLRPPLSNAALHIISYGLVPSSETKKRRKISGGSVSVMTIVVNVHGWLFLGKHIHASSLHKTFSRTSCTKESMHATRI